MPTIKRGGKTIHLPYPKQAPEKLPLQRAPKQGKQLPKKPKKGM